MLPSAIAPFEVALLQLGMASSPEVRSAAETLHDDLLGAGIEVLMDDRDEGPGVKFADADLIGLPVRLVVSPRSLERGGVEIKMRSDPASAAVIVPVSEIVARVKSVLRS